MPPVRWPPDGVIVVTRGAAAKASNVHQQQSSMLAKAEEKKRRTEALEADTFPLVFQRIYSAFASPAV